MDVLNRVGEGTRDDVIAIAAERFERRLAEEIGGLETRLASQMAALQAGLIRWMVGLWLAGILGLAGLLATLSRLPAGSP